MTQTIIYAIITLGAIGVAAAIILYFVSQKFKVYEDPKIDEIADLLPGANCGGCGFAGCRNFAEAIVKEGINGKSCPAAGEAANKQIAEIMGETLEVNARKIAAVRCNGSCENAPAKTAYDSIASCAYANMLSAGETGCGYGCLGLGDCVNACKFGAIKIDEETKLPVFLSQNCVLCGACVKACPRSILEIRNKQTEGAVWVACMNKEKGVEAKKNCKVACIACRKCEKVCEFQAISVENNLAFIDSVKCTACKKCVEACPTGAILESM